MRKILAYKTLARSINLTDVEFTRSLVQNAGGNTLDKLTDHSERGIMNISSISNIESHIQICQTPTWYWTFIWSYASITDTLHFVNKSKIVNFLEKFYIYSETIWNNEINEESTRGFNKTYSFMIWYGNNKYRLDNGTCLPIHSLSQPHASSQQVPIAPPPSCKCDRTTHHNTKILSEHTACKYFILLIDML